MEMDQIILKSCDKLIGLMLRQLSYHSLRVGGRGTQQGTSHLICSAQACSCHKGNVDTHTHRKHWSIYFFKLDLCLLICPPSLFLTEGCSPPWTNSILLPGSHQTKPHSSAITYQIRHQRITSELSVSVSEPRRFYCSCVFLPLL